MAEQELDLDKMTPEEIAELQRKNCIFCKIANKEIPSKIIHEDEDIICILDINPASEGHILVYPKKHYMILPHLPDGVLRKLFLRVKIISNHLLKALQSGGTTVFVANGSAAGQKAPHVLVHVFARRNNDGLVKLPNYSMTAEQSEKLKGSLKPYINHLFGNGAFDSKSDLKNDHDDEDDSADALEEKRPEKPEKHEKPKSKSKEPSKENKDKKESKEKLSLDDIGKLFGA